MQDVIQANQTMTPNGLKPHLHKHKVIRTCFLENLHWIYLVR